MAALQIEGQLGGKVTFIIYMYKVGREVAPRHSRQLCSVSDDELIHTPVLVASIWQVTANDDWDLPGPVMGRSPRM